MRNHTIRPGLVSVTFRSLSPREIVQMAIRAELAGIEWGGDIHVPSGITAVAREIGQMTREAGLRVVSYGSYYRAGESQEFGPILDSTVALGAPRVRVWAGVRGSSIAEPADVERVVSDLVQICEKSAKVNLDVALEFHAGTLTDSIESTLALIRSVDQSNLKCHWQPDVNLDFHARRFGLVSLIPRLACVHVFNWLKVEQSPIRLPLEDASAEWRRYFDDCPDETFGLLEFVRDDSVEQFYEDAAALRRIIYDA